ncbi:hypothetical protein D3C86_1499520 [compost metagenome]
MNCGEPDVEVIPDELEVTALQIPFVLESTVVEADSPSGLIDLTYHLTARPLMVDVNGDDAKYADRGLRAVDHFVVPGHELA